MTHYEVLEITPEVAVRWLAQTTITQRNLTKRRVATFARSMEKGRWQVTHQPIALDSHGNVIDGQHRLHAVILARVAVKMTVAFDADPDTFGVIDRMGVRNNTQILRLAGHTQGSTLGAAGRAILAYDVVAGTRESWEGALSLVMPEDLLELYSSDRGELVKACLAQAQRIAGSMGKHGIEGMLTAALTAIHEAPGQDSQRDHFLAQLQDGLMLDIGSPVLALRRWLMGSTGMAALQGHKKTPSGIAVTIKCYNDCLTGTPRTQAAFRANEAMPRVRSWAPPQGEG